MFPYAIWAFLEAGETPADAFDAGFLPSTRQLDRFYLCRHLRVDLARYAPSSENRRVLRKGHGIRTELVPGNAFVLTPERRALCRRYIDARFGPKGMADDRLDSLFTSPVTTHVLIFSENETEIGYVTLYVESGRMAFYYYAFYALGHANRSLGMLMMTTAVELFARRGCSHLYLGTCYSESALYKTQFSGMECFNGFSWSPSLAELKFILRRQLRGPEQHLLEDPEYLSGEWATGPGQAAGISRFRCL
ncbi:MAG: hypothetical protein HYV75_09210 [Opitutae bacterium]|nr:hypothetical protein [Opitutae bacterium]